MTQELVALVLLAIMAGGLWIPFIVAINTQDTNGETADAFVVPPRIERMPPHMRRLHRAHLNLLEQLLPFALMVLIAQQIGLSNTVTVVTAWLFLALRIAHAIVMMTGKPRWALRPIIFTMGFACILVFGVQLLMA
ncbi:MAG: MAPEG family protein [Pseudomonadota bacterium]